MQKIRMTMTLVYEFDANPDGWPDMLPEQIAEAEAKRYFDKPRDLLEYAQEYGSVRLQHEVLPGT